MQRRTFLASLAAALGAGTFAGCAGAPGRAGGDRRAAGPLDAQAFHRSRRYAATSFGRIAYVERGAGPAALFLHGFPLSGFQWRGALERLADVRRCVAPDFLGLGYTEVAPGQDVAPEAQVAMLVAVLDHLGIEAADVVASDSGGAVAQLLLVHHPRRVRSLLLTNCDTEIDSPPPALLPVIELAKAGTWVDQWLAPWRADPGLARSAQGIGGMCYVDPAHPTDQAIECYFAPLLASPQRKALAHAYAIALERNALAGIEPLLARSTAPTRVVWGMADTIFAPASPAYLDRVLGRSRGVRELPDRKLFWPEELPDVIAAEARTLWS